MVRFFKKPGLNLKKHLREAEQKIYFMTEFNIYLLHKANKGHIGEFHLERESLLHLPHSLFETLVNKAELSNWFYLSNLPFLLWGDLSSAPGANALIFFVSALRMLAPPSGGCTNFHPPDSSYTHTKKTLMGEPHSRQYARQCLELPASNVKQRQMERQNQTQK